MKFGKTTLFLCAFLLFTLASVLHAQEYEEIEYNSEITFFAGGFLGDSVVLSGVGPIFQPVEIRGAFDDDFIGGARLTYFFNPILGIEGGIGFTPASIASALVVDGGSNYGSVIDVDTYIFNANLVAQFGRGPIQPFVTGGVAAVHFSFDTTDYYYDFVTPSETDFAWNIGAGVKFRATETVFLRFDGRYYQANSEFSDENVEFTEISGGLSIKFNF